MCARYGPDFPFSGEKMSVTMALYRAPDISAAVDLTNNIQNYQVCGEAAAHSPAACSA